ncbi:hypothetical protein BpHYR1_009517 [Brachionus plicatilis]|uniref:Uncharacterized protein n=1 Tax=Brachionus plicatilis TaxID=10195 RepID=A0A3M7SU24_BRAPC|nr:hypothetical protein BpHYR1_009517 [Brachionus plicatilis]
MGLGLSKNRQKIALLSIRFCSCQTRFCAVGPSKTLIGTNIVDELNIYFLNLGLNNKLFELENQCIRTRFGMQYSSFSARDHEEIHLK